MAGFIFQGSSSVTMDQKGRILIPARHREALSQQCEGRLTLTRHPDGCLLLFPRPVWETKRQEIAALPMSARAWQRFFLGSAVDVEIDSAGRILVPPELRKAADLSRDVTLMGIGSCIEIWDDGKLAVKEAEAIAGGMPESIQSFSF